MIRIAVVEDNAEYANLFGEKLLEADFKHDILVDIYLNSMDFLNGLKKGYRICFLDIKMPGMDGVKLAEEIRKNDSRIMLIFLSSYLEYATEGYRVRAFDYLLKGKIDSKWDALVGRIIKRLEDDNEKVYRVTTENRVITIPIDDIIYIYKAGNYCNFVLMDWQKNVTVRKPIWKMEEELKPYKYFIHAKRGHIINIRKIREYKAKEVIMENGDVISIGRTHVTGVKDKVMEYMGN